MDINNNNNNHSTPVSQLHSNSIVTNDEKKKKLLQNYNNYLLWITSQQTNYSDRKTQFNTVLHAERINRKQENFIPSVFQLLTMIDLLKSLPMSQAFLAPVNPIALGIPDYFDKISEPMDLCSLENGLRTSSTNPIEGLRKLFLIWKNAMSYNPPTHYIHQDASSLEEICESQLDLLYILKEIRKGTSIDEDYCGICDKKFGTDFLCCDGGCHRIFHPECTGVSLSTEHSFICPDCKSGDIWKVPLELKKTREMIDALLDYLVIYIDPHDKNYTFLCTAFLFLPDKVQIPSYFQKVADPISLSDILTTKYNSPQDFVDDFLLLIKNTKTFYHRQSPVVKDANKYDKLLREKVPTLWPNSGIFKKGKKADDVHDVKRRKTEELSDDEKSGNRRLSKRYSKGKVSYEDKDEDEFLASSDDDMDEVEEKAEAPKVEKMLSHRYVPDPNNPSQQITEFFVKWKGKAYIHCSWIKESDILATSHGKLRLTYYWRDRERKLPDDDEPFPPEYLEVDRIVAAKQEINPDTNRPYYLYLIKWKELPYSDVTWEQSSDFDDDEKIEQYKINQSRPQTSNPPRGGWQTIDNNTIAWKSGNQLRDYQLAGLNWLSYCWYNRRGCILADEMGLGKTVQSITFLASLALENIYGPFLIVAPLSTLGHWQREISEWTNINCVVYQGNATSREIIRKYEFTYFDGNKDELRMGKTKFNVLLTTYEMLLKPDWIELSVIPWRVIVVDEAQRLKNASSKLLENLKQLKLIHRILLTGTPLQNRMEELWTLLNFIEPIKFASQEDFLKQFGDMQNHQQVQNLHEIIRPHLLRRMKGDVEKSIPPKEETLIEVELTSVQKQYYKAMLEKNRDFLAKGCNPKNQPHLLNIVMQLRKVCNHPYLIEGVEQKEIDEKGDSEYFENFVKACGKMVLLDKLLPKLKAGGHKILIFSQMVKVLDLLENFLSHKAYKFERLDGRIRGNERQGAIDRFCRDPDKFVFLLCTRAGGVGINLAAADTVIIYDSDWNPQNDIQAQARCHRIGQKKEVKVYRLITAKTYEKQMFEMASKKLGLDQAVLHDMGSEKSTGPKLDKKEIDQLLKFGAYDLFQDNESNFAEENIDQILNRASKVVWNPEITENNNGASSFSTATFDIGESASKVDMDDPDFWEKVLPQAKTVDLLLTKLAKGEPFETKLARDQWLHELKAFVHEVLEAFAKGKSDSVVTTRMSLLELFNFLKQHEKEFETEQWEELSGWIKEITNPRRLRKSISRYASYEDEDSLSSHKKKSKDKRKSGIYDKNSRKTTTPLPPIIHDPNSPKTPYQWLSKERYAFHNALFAFPIGRWEHVQAKSKHPPIELSSLKDYTKEFIKQCIFHAEENERALFIEWLEPLFSEDEAQDIEINLNSDFTKFIKGKIKGWVRNIKVLNSFEEFVTPHLSNLNTLREKLVNVYRPVTKWWTQEEDINLFQGAHKYGIADFDSLPDDPQLTFHKYKDLINQTEKKVKDENLDKKDDDDDIKSDNEEKSDDEDDNMEEVKNNINTNNINNNNNNNDAPKKKSSKSEAAKRMAASESNDWPPRHILYAHLKWLLENLKKLDEGRSRAKGFKGGFGFKKDRKVNEWSKREQQDFRTVVACYGISDWDLVKAKASLNKNTEQCEEYWEQLKDLCSQTLLTSPEDRNELEEDSKILPISSTMARKILRNVEILQTVKTKLLPHPKLEEKLSAMDTHDMPGWWYPPLHDKLLLESCLKMGLGGKDWDTWLEDPNNLFYQTEEGKTDYRKQKGKFLLGFVKEKSQLVGRLDYLKNVILEGEEGSDLLKKKKFGSRSDFSQPVLTRSSGINLGSNSDEYREIEPRRLQVRNIERDEEGNPILPIFAKGAHIQSLGVVDYTRPAFHAKKYIYTIGYQSTRSLPSCLDPSESVIYYSEITDGGNHPLFCVWAADNPQKIWKHTTPSGVWQNVLREVRRKPNVSVSGPEMFGFSDLTIKMLIQELPGAEKCKNYVFDQFSGGIHEKVHQPAAYTLLPPKNTRSNTNLNNNNNNNNTPNFGNAYTAISSFPIPVSSQKSEPMNEIKNEIIKDEEEENQLENIEKNE